MDRNIFFGATKTLLAVASAFALLAPLGCVRVGYQLLPVEGETDGRAHRDSGVGGDGKAPPFRLDSTVVSPDGGPQPVKVDALPTEADALPVDGDVDGGSGTDALPQWVRFDGGSFMMGAVDGSGQEETVPAFEITRTEVTVAQYLRCMDDDACDSPGSWSGGCYWDAAGYGDYPVNCVKWDQSTAYCAWAGGRLPSGAEWEYAARSGGRNNLYPWGNEPAPSCEHVVMNEGAEGCDTGAPMPVCSRPRGNTAYGLCDMAGNVFEWVLERVGRGGGFTTPPARARRLRTIYPGFSWGDDPYQNLYIGMRCVRDVP